MIRVGLFLFILFTFSVANADIQDDRAAYIQKLASAGIISGTRIINGAPVLVVTAKFHKADFESKSDATGIIFRYFQGNDADLKSYAIVDRSGRTIGIRTRNDLTLY